MRFYRLDSHQILLNLNTKSNNWMQTNHYRFMFDMIKLLITTVATTFYCARKFV